MISFKNFVHNNSIVTEDLITFGKKAFPKFNQVVILAGGAGSGKGFVQQHLLGIEGKVFDVDAFKEASLKLPKFQKEIEERFGVKLNNDFESFKKACFKNPEIVSWLHYRTLDGNAEEGIVGLNWDKKVQSMLMASLTSDNRPNLIFDNTLKKESKIDDIVDSVEQFGYKREDIHLVWILNDIKTAIDQNATRDRTVALSILMGTHEGAGETMAKILYDTSESAKKIDGDIWIVFNKAFVDVKLDTRAGRIKEGEPIPSGILPDKKGKYKGAYVSDSLLLKVKEKGKAILSYDNIADKYLQKIIEYVPKDIKNLF